jgi:LacI family transcriptional regulator
MSPKHITMERIAREAKVPRTTVSFALNNTPNKNIPEVTRQRVLDVAQKLGYFDQYVVDQELIAFVIHQTPGQIAQDALLGEVLGGLPGVIEPYGYHVGLFPVPVGNPRRYVGLVVTHRPQGIVLSGPVEKDNEELQTPLEQNVPAVIWRQVENPELYCVDVDNVRGAYIAVKYLLKLGHRRIATITNASLSYTASADRLLGYRQALAEYEIPYDDTLVRHGAFTSDSGYRSMVDILNTAGDLPSAVFVASDVVARGAIQAIRQWGFLIPDDISIVGFDDIPLASYLSPSLTSVRTLAADLGRHAGQVLMGLRHNNAVQPCRVLLDSILKIRDSTCSYQQPYFVHGLLAGSMKG